jgi:putative ABC transport system permease protein
VKYLVLLASNLTRKKLRTLFTLLSIVMAFLLYGLLAAVEKATVAGLDLAGIDRLVTIHKVSLIQFLPISYKNRIRQVEGVADVSSSTWFGALYQDSRHVIGAFPVDPTEYLHMYPEILLPEGQKKAWLADRAGMIVGRVLAAKYGWKVGDRIPLTSDIWSKQDGNFTWEMNISGIYGTKDNLGDQSSILMRYDYFNESRAYSKDTVGWYVVKITDPQHAPAIAAKIDALFANSPAETKTSTEKAFAQSFANQIGDIAAIIAAVVGAVLFTMLLVTANTMGQSVRERTRELALLKTLGFSGVAVTTLVLAESLLITTVGGLLGLACAEIAIVLVGDTVRNYFPVFYLPAHDIGIACIYILVLGLLAGALPAAQTMRLKIVDAMRRT